MSGEHAQEVDLDRVRAEIEAEARRLRESGEIGSELERELDLVFARFAPVDAVQGDFESVMVRVDELTKFDLNPPLETTNPVVAFVKRAVRKAIRWYARWLVSQTSALGHALARAVRLLDARLDALEAALPPTDGPVARTARLADDGTEWKSWLDAVFAGLGTQPGRVAVAECGKGGLLSALVAAGVSAYGVEPIDVLAQEADDSGLEVRRETALDHLGKLADRSLGGLVLTGVVDRLPPGGAVQLISLAGAKLAAGGRLVMIASHPGAWSAVRSAIEVDLSAGHPMHPETWCHLLGEGPFDGVEIRPGEPRTDGLAPISGRDTQTEVLNDNIQRLNEVLFPPASFLVTARRR